MCARCVKSAKNNKRMVAAANSSQPSSIWLPTGPARWSGLEVSRPILVVFYHLEKTGGTAVMKWLHKMANTKHVEKRRGVTIMKHEQPRLTSLMDFTHTSCFFALYPKLYPGYADAWDPRRCTAPSKPRWQTSAVAVEFHAYSRRRYWEELHPKLDELRKLYAAQNGIVLTIATFREPISHVLSVYRMWPPSKRCKCGERKIGKHAVPLPEWLPRAVGLQAGSLTLDSWPHVRKGFHNLAGCASQQVGRERLQSFDVIGVMDCMGELLRATCHALQWPCEADEWRLEHALKQALRQRPHGVSNRGTMVREASEWSSLSSLNATTRAGVARAAECDKVLYDDAIRRMGLVPPAGHGVALNRSFCNAGRFVRG